MADDNGLPDQASAKAWVAQHIKTHGQSDDPHGKETHDDVIDDREGQLGPPDWAKAGKDAPHGWKKVDDTYVED